MKFSRKQILVIITVMILLSTIGITSAYIFNSHEVNVTSGVSTEGAVVTYELDGTLLNQLDFDNFHPTNYMQTQGHYFSILNEGNARCNVTWEIAGSSVSWIPVYYPAGESWYYAESPAPEQYIFFIDDPEDGTSWDPAGHGYITLDVGESAVYEFVLRYTGYDKAAGDLMLHIHFATTDVIT